MLTFIVLLVAVFLLWKLGRKFVFEDASVTPTESLEEKRNRLQQLKEEAANLEEEVKVTTDIKGVTEKVNTNRSELEQLETEIKEAESIQTKE